MKGVTHAVFGALVGVPLALATGQPALVGVGLVAGLVPDLDASDATLKHWTITTGRGKHRREYKPFYLLSAAINALFGHRGFWHSIYCALIFGGIFGWWQGWAFGLTVAGGYLIHLLLDAATPSGVPIIMRGPWHLLPPRLRIQTGSEVEYLLLAIAAVIVLGYAINQLFAGTLFNLV